MIAIVEPYWKEKLPNLLGSHVDTTLIDMHEDSYSQGHGHTLNQGEGHLSCYINPGLLKAASLNRQFQCKSKKNDRAQTP